MASHDGSGTAGGGHTARTGTTVSARTGTTPPVDAPRVPGPRQRARQEARQRPSRRKRKTGAKRFLKPVAIGAGTCLVAAAASGWFYYENLNANIKHGALNTSDVNVPQTRANAAGQTPLNILLLGSDGRGDKRNCDLGGACDSGPPHADVEMLLHVSADRSNASVLSIPRDTKVDIPPCRDPKTGQSFPAVHDIITTSLGRGGPGCVVGTWQQLTRIHIDHYMMVDFGGVVDMADAVGGVPVCVDHNVSDNQVSVDRQGRRHVVGSHLRLPEGTHVIRGVQALEWLRTRHAFEDGTDIGRTHAQHLYMNSLIRQMKAASTLTNPLKLNALAQQATRSLTVDDGLSSIKALADLALDLNRVPTKRITMTTMPFSYIPTDQAHVQPRPEAARVFAMIANDIPLDRNGPAKAAGGRGAGAAGGASPASSTAASPAAASSAPVDKAAVRVAVRNGGGVDGRARAMAGFLTARGFSQASVDATPLTAKTTSVFYPAAEKAQALAVAAALGIPVSRTTASPRVDRTTVVIGADWSSGTDFASTLPKAGDLPATAVSQNAETDKGQCMRVNTAKYADGRSIYIW
ncbi:LCP family protein [Streptomyces sp. NPDC001380]|uniref:LCP family protein n=1 Tax=Streptomyces sp. NPDC001380 TaxID=3364566 RepID=UPI0036C2D886